MKQALLFAAIFVVATASCGVAAEEAVVAPPVTNPPPEPGGVFDDTTLWRQFHVAGASRIRGVDGSLRMMVVNWSGWQRTDESRPHSPLPSANWADPAFDDSAWPRFRLPQPVLPSTPLGFVGGGMHPRTFPYDTLVVLARGTFEVKDPARVQACTLSVDYWGGVVVYVNGRELVRGHLASGPTNLLDAVPEDYPDDAYLSPDGKATVDGRYKDRLALRDRRLRDVKIPTTFLRQGVNVVAIEVHAAPITAKVFAKHVYSVQGEWDWPPIGLLSARLTVSPPGAEVANTLRPGGLQVWNCAATDNATVLDYGAPSEPLRPILVRAARNSVFSGRLMVGSGQPIKGLKVQVTDLALSLGKGKIPASAVRVRYAEPAAPAKGWVPGGRFDGLLDAIPAEIPVVNAPAENRRFYQWSVRRSAIAAGAVAPLWFTVRVPAGVPAGEYEGTVSLAAEGLKPVKVPLRVIVSAVTLPNPQNFCVQNFLCHSEETEARYYGVAPWSDKHFERIGKSLALMAEVNSRQVYANLTTEFFGPGSNPESLVRWIKQPDGSFKHDFTVFDKYMDMVAKYLGKPRPLRLNCWPDCGNTSGSANGGFTVSVLDPATGKVSAMPQPAPGTAENLAFWQPVFAEIFKKLKARGWLDETTFGYNSYASVPPPAVVDVAYKLWPEGGWSFASHAGAARMKFKGSQTNVVMNVRQSTALWGAEAGNSGQPMPRRDTFCRSPRAGGGMDALINDFSPAADYRSVVEEVVRPGYDGICEFGVDLFPMKTPSGGYGVPPFGRGVNWAWPGRSPLAILAPGPDGPVATDRFEMFREGLELTEVLLYVQQAVWSGNLSDDLKKRAKSVLDARDQAFYRGWFGFRHMPSAYDQELLDIAGEVAREVQR